MGLKPINGEGVNNRVIEAIGPKFTVHNICYVRGRLYKDDYEERTAR